jgi:hypothetical protein
MLPTMPDQSALNAMVTRFTAYYDGATPDQVNRGLTWYPNACDLATMLGDGDSRMGAGLIAVLSANKRWRENVRLAEDATRGHVHGHVSQVLAKVQAILQGTDPMEVLPMEFKTGQFFLAILGDPDAVVIDRHVHDIAAGEPYGERNRGLSNARRYSAISLALRTAAFQRKVSPRDFQSVIWVRRLDQIPTGRGLSD